MGFSSSEDEADELDGWRARLEFRLDCFSKESAVEIKSLLENMRLSAGLQEDFLSDMVAMDCDAQKSGVWFGRNL